MTRKSVWEYAAALRQRYLLAGKGERSRLLTEFCQTTGYHRKAAVACKTASAHAPSRASRSARSSRRKTWKSVAAQGVRWRVKPRARTRSAS